MDKKIEMSLKSQKNVTSKVTFFYLCKQYKKL